MEVMETIDVELSEFTLRRRSLQVSHVTTSLSRGLEPGEQVILRDATRGCFAAHVVELGFEPADTLYRLRVGVRLTRSEAMEQRDPVAGEPRRLTRQDLLDLLGQLRAGTPAIPADPAAGRHRRAGTAL